MNFEDSWYKVNDVSGIHDRLHEPGKFLSVILKVDDPHPGFENGFQN